MSADVDAAIERLLRETWCGNPSEGVAADVRLVLAALLVAQDRNTALADIARVAIIRGSLR